MVLSVSLSEQNWGHRVRFGFEFGQLDEGKRPENRDVMQPLCIDPGIRRRLGRVRVWMGQGWLELGFGWVRVWARKGQG